MTRIKKRGTLVVLLLAFSMIAAACGGTDDTTTTAAAVEATTTTAGGTETTEPAEETTTTAEAMLGEGITVAKLRADVRQILQGMRHADFLTRGAEINAAFPVQPMGAGVQARSGPSL